VGDQNNNGILGGGNSAHYEAPDEILLEG
jgi:hypothetical protein